MPMHYIQFQLKGKLTMPFQMRFTVKNMVNILLNSGVLGDNMTFEDSLHWYMHQDHAHSGWGMPLGLSFSMEMKPSLADQHLVLSLESMLQEMCQQSTHFSH